MLLGSRDDLMIYTVVFICVRQPACLPAYPSAFSLVCLTATLTKISTSLKSVNSGNTRLVVSELSGSL